MRTASKHKLLIDALSFCEKVDTSPQETPSDGEAQGLEEHVGFPIYALDSDCVHGSLVRVFQSCRALLGPCVHIPPLY
jgi:hypothetical protein